MTSFRWQCPYCGSHSIVTNANHSVDVLDLEKTSRHGPLALVAVSTSCPNTDCKELELKVYWGSPKKGQYGTTGITGPAQGQRQLLPEAKVIPLPDDIPEEIRITYRETVLVAEISGRAGAAMARRCLQGIVRDFFEIPTNKRGNLGAELSFVKDKIDPDLWEAIQSVRGIGDIGAHMDKNVDRIIDVTPDEAGLLIKLIETLFQDWYIARKKRRANQEALRSLLADKRELQKAAKEVKSVPDILNSVPAVETTAVVNDEK